MDLSGKTILITGSATGIGEAMARLCHANGANIVIHGKDANEAKRVAEDLRERVLARTDDLADPTTPELLVKVTVETFGRIDALVNNAAVITRKDLVTSSPEQFDHDFAVNTRAPLFLIKAALPHLTEAKGQVLTIGSINQASAGCAVAATIMQPMASAKRARYGLI